jgi:hypothetical protein
MDGEIGRRRLLAAGGAAATAATAGCLDAIPSLGGNWTDVRQYMRSGEAVDRDRPDFTIVEPSDLAPHEDAMHDDVSFRGQPHVPVEATSGEPAFGIEWSNLNAVVGVGWYRRDRMTSHVLDVDYDRDALTDRLDGWDFSKRDDYEGFEVWARHVPDFEPSEGEEGRFEIKHLRKGQAVAMRDRLLVTANVYHNTQMTYAEATIDAIVGSADRYTEENDDGAALLDHLGDGGLRWGQLFDGPQPESLVEGNWGAFEDQVAQGTGLTVHGEQSTLRAVRVFDEPENLDMGDIEDWVTKLPKYEAFVGPDTEETRRPYENLDASAWRDGRVAVVEGRMPSSDLATRWP